MKALIAIAVVWLAALTAALVVLGFRRPETPLPTGCEATRSQPICRTSLVVIAGAPDRYYGARLDGRGYVAVDDGYLAIYPTKGHFEAGDQTLAVEVRGDPDWQRDFARRFGGKFVMFGGTFGPPMSGRHRFMGTLENAAGMSEVPASTHGDPEGLLIRVDH